MTTILATLDGSGESRAVLPILKAVATGLKAEVRLLTVVHPPDVVPGGREPPSVPIGEAQAVGPGPSDANLPRLGHVNPRGHGETRDQAIARVEHVALEQLEEAAKPLRDAGLSVKPEVIMADNAAPVIIGAARDAKVDLIAMATHGRSGLRAIVQGSVATEVLRSGVAPVLLVRPQ